MDCYKIAYESAGEARRAAAQLSRRSKTHTNVYRCSFCGYWHITRKDTGSGRKYHGTKRRLGG